MRRLKLVQPSVTTLHSLFILLAIASLPYTGMGQSQTLHINGPRLYGARPGKEFMYTIPVSGQRPMMISIDHLPAGVTLDKTTGIISGIIQKPGEYQLEIKARNKYGGTSKILTLVIGDQLALTPPMGWSSWYSFGRSVTLEKVIRSARIMKAKGLPDYGWSVIEIDDPWTNQPSKDDSIWNTLKSYHGDVYEYHEGPDNLPGRVGKVRDEQGELIPNQYFKDIRKFPAVMHAMGFKAGIYSSPGPLTCGGVAGSYGHEQTDAAWFSNCGFDYLKYDWCSYGSLAGNNSKTALIKPYRLMADMLLKQKRDIILGLCQYGMGNVWEWGNESGGQLWRTEGDITDNWDAIYKAMHKLADKSQYVKPGNWNDPDILQLGIVGAQHEGEARRNHLSAEEQKTHFSMWCMLSAPLLLGANVELLDDTTMQLLTNEEVIAIDQDGLGKAASLDSLAGVRAEVWKKPLEDGSLAIGLLNPTSLEMTVSVPLRSLGLTGHSAVRDLWQRKDIGVFEDSYTTTIASHGIVLLKLVRQ